MSTQKSEEEFSKFLKGNSNKSVMTKVCVIVLLILGLLIPLWMISGVITERQNRKNEVSREIADTWGSSQTVIGPILVIPYRAPLSPYDTRKQTELIKFAYLLPNQYSITNDLKSGIRYRGIYKSVVYTSNLTAKGNFSLDDLKELKIAEDNIIWNDAFLAINISQSKNIQEHPILQCDGRSLEILPGIHGIHLFDTGLYALYKYQPESHTIPFSLKLALKGSETFSFVPIGKQNKFEVSSDWSTPSFTGNVLPTTRNISSNGFSASWDIPYFARNYPQVFLDGQRNCLERIKESQVGVSLLNPIDSYRESDRAIKYAILFLVLTFSTYFIFEILGKLRLHPFQYFLIGCALCLFYLLLLAFAEVIGFNPAYTIASLAIVGAITLYSYAIIGNAQKHLAFIIGGMLSSLYVYLYILLQLEDLSLLCGTIGLFIFLVAIMYLTRNIDWYKDQVSVGGL